MKRLSRESLLLSSTGFLSSRFVRFLESGFISPIFNSMESVDEFFHEKITGTVFGRFELRKRFVMPMRNMLASFFANNKLMKIFSAIQNATLAASLRSVGVLFITFGIYASAIFVLKRYISSTLGASTADDVAVALVSFVIGLLLTCFGDKSILSSLGSSKITGTLLSEVLGVNNSTFERIPRSGNGSAIGFGFLVGSLLGVTTLFTTPARSLLGFGFLLLMIAILNIPEFGLLLSVLTFSFVSTDYLAAFVAMSIFSFVLKCLRLKRNLRFGTSDAVFLMTYIAVFLASISSEGALARGEAYLLFFLGVFFLAKNLICSEKLLSQAMNALSLGVFVGMVLFLAGEYSSYIPQEHLRMAVLRLSSNTLPADFLAVSVCTVLPISLSSFSSARMRSAEWLFVIMAIGCVFATDSYMFALMLCLSAFLYFAFAYKAFVGSAIFSLVLSVPILGIVSDYARSVAVVPKELMPFDAMFRIAPSVTFGGFFGAFESLCGPLAPVLCVVALALILQRSYGCVIQNSSISAGVIYGSIAASETATVVCMLYFNSFSDLRMMVPMWFLLGLSGSVKTVFVRSRRHA